MRCFFTIILAIVGAVLYRMGGAGRTGKWYDPLLDTKVRDLGVPAMALTVLWIWHGFILDYWWAYFISYGLMFGSLTTYWKKKGTDARWYNWLFTGLGYSIALAPWAIATGDWVGFGVRTVLLTAGVTIWSELISNPVIEELGRGFIVVITVWILYLTGRRKDKN